MTTPAGVRIHYETTGDPGGRPLVLVHGGGAQLIGWPEGFVEQLAAAGFLVVRPDNRDVGLSQMTAGPDDLTATYDLDDMADDVVALLDHLGLASAHLTGMSMGGFIVQLVAIRHPGRVASLGLMSTCPSSDPEFLVPPTGDRTPLTELPEPLTREAYVEMFVGGQRGFASPGFPFDAQESAELGARYYDRVYRPDGLLRQWNAMLRGPLERRAGLARVTAPAVVLHGRGDQCVHWRSALVTAELLPHAEVHVYEEMGHDVPRELWPEFVLALARTARRAERAAP
ncbi:alpha/beta fold hydrolase [Kineococcus sp. SYSU DK002]|uniref:alpha/beta fold hydrolase n=1 Tax=Kineococcus sp. SYSU DK002 TaxID=3383123 RepID=UPI003D7EAF08